MTKPFALLATVGLLGSLWACEQRNQPPAPARTGEAPHQHADGTTHMHGEGNAHAHDDDHEHDEVELGTFEFGNPPMQVGLAQSHGSIEAGKEGHLVVKLPYNDGGATIVRAWLGTDDRTLSYVGRGEYAASHDDYDIHAMAPDPLPENTMWWIEIEKPDGTKVIGSAKPKMD
jgi:hypothetical protein